MDYRLFYYATDSDPDVMWSISSYYVLRLHNYMRTQTNIIIKIQQAPTIMAAFLFALVISSLVLGTYNFGWRYVLFSGISTSYYKVSLSA